MNWNDFFSRFFLIHLNVGFIVLLYYIPKKYITDLKAKRSIQIPLIQKLVIGSSGFLIILSIAGIYANPTEGKEKLFTSEFIIFSIPYIFGLIEGFRNNKK